MRVAVGLLLGVQVLWLVSCGSDTSELKGLNQEWRPAMEIGKGYCAISDMTRGVCVDIGAEPVVQPGAQTTTFRMEMVENSEELASLLNVSAAAQLNAISGGLSEVSAKTKFVSERRLNRYSVYLVVYARVENEHTLVPSASVSMKESINEMLAQNSSEQSTDEQLSLFDDDTLDSFRMRCGDYFLSGYSTGGEYYGVIEIETMSDSQKQEIANEIAASGILGIGKVGGSVGSEVESLKLSAAKRVRVWSSQGGGTGESASPVVAVKEMLERAKSMPKIVAAQDDAAILGATFEDYLTLDMKLPKEHVKKLWDAKMFIRTLGRKQSELIGIRDDIDYILENPAEFLDIDSKGTANLEFTRQLANDELTKIVHLATQCYSDYRSCSESEKVEVPNFEAPEREQSAGEESGSLGWEYEQISHSCTQNFLSNGLMTIRCRDWQSEAELFFKKPTKWRFGGREYIRGKLFDDDFFLTGYDDPAGCYVIPVTNGSETQKLIARDVYRTRNYRKPVYFHSVTFNPRKKLDGCYELVAAEYR